MAGARGVEGVVYISRIPPHMKPSKVRQVLSVHGEVRQESRQGGLWQGPGVLRVSFTSVASRHTYSPAKCGSC